MRKTFRFLAEARPAAPWQARFRAAWPGARRWYLKDGAEARPSLPACAGALERDMPELAPMWRHLCALAGGGELESRMLSLWSPPNVFPDVFPGCSVAVAQAGAFKIL